MRVYSQLQTVHKDTNYLQHALCAMFNNNDASIIAVLSKRKTKAKVQPLVTITNIPLIFHPPTDLNVGGKRPFNVRPIATWKWTIDFNSPISSRSHHRHDTASDVAEWHTLSNRQRSSAKQQWPTDANDLMWNNEVTMSFAWHITKGAFKLSNSIMHRCQFNAAPQH